MTKMFSQNNLFPGMFTLAFTIIICFMLFIPPQIGIANSGDFGRLMDIFDLYYVPDYSNFKNFYDTFTFGRPENAPHYNGYMATSSIFILLALPVNKIFTLFSSDENMFYIYSLSLVYSITYIIGFYLLIQVIFKQLLNKYMACLVSLIALIILSDSLFVEYFNSFFQEAGVVVCILLFVACFLRYNIFILDIVLLTLVIFSKEQNILYLLLLFPIFMKYGINFKKILLICVFLSFPFYVYTNINTYSKDMNTFAALFDGVLHNDTQEEGTTILTQLNLDPRYAIFTGKGYWSTAAFLNASQSQENYLLWQQSLVDATRMKTFQGYMLYPQKLVTNTLDYLAVIKKDGPFAPNLGNYKVDQDPKFRVESFHIFSDYLKNFAWPMLLNLALSVLLVIYYLKTRKKTMPIKDKKVAITKDELPNILILLSTLTVIALAIIPVNIVGTGFEEIVKHVLNAYLTEGIITILNIFICVIFIDKIRAQSLSLKSS